MSLTETKKSRLELAIEAQDETRANINVSRLQTLNGLAELKSIGGKDNYQEAIEYLLVHTGPKGLLMTDIRAVLPDAVELTKAKKALDAAKKIEVEAGKPERLILKTKE